MKKDKTPKLTAKKAKALAVKVLGTAKGLERDQSFQTIETYNVQFGFLFARFQPDWYGSGLFSASISNHFGNDVFLLFNPETLEEDYEAEDRQKESFRREKFADWVNSNGPEVCKAAIDREWSRDRW